MDSLSISLLPLNDKDENFHDLHPTSSGKYFIGIQESHSEDSIFVSFITFYLSLGI